jgi:hypothetical protein
MAANNKSEAGSMLHGGEHSAMHLNMLLHSFEYKKMKKKINQQKK